jgi:hypothetical protein
MGTMVILPDFLLPTRANQTWQYSGIDSLSCCANKQHFLSYPHHIEYVFNSRGFRDTEWPVLLNELKNAVWCVGDSFTVGIGQPFSHTWPQVLSKKLRRRTINVSMDGASNDWIFRKVCRIIEVVDPTNIVIMWSYSHRRELHDSDLMDEDRRVQFTRASTKEDYANWANLSNNLAQLSKSVIQTTIPNFHNFADKKIERMHHCFSLLVSFPLP